jgi:carbonic anhydrase/acetyltransferase-like protein (isoleucine patch superfamily)
MKTETLISSCGAYTPRIHAGAFVDMSARIMGDVVIEEGASIWPMAVLRADSETIYIGKRSAVLDLCLLEAPENSPVVVEEASLISHGAIIHGAHICSGVLVGIRATVLDGAIISSGSIVGATSLVTAGTLIPANSLVMGIPARVIRETTDMERETIREQLEGLHKKANRYRMAKG